MGGLQRRVSVLVVEDEFLIALDVEDKFQQLGFRDVYVVHSVEQGRDVLRDHVIGLAFLDVNLGREVVFPLAEELRARKIPIVFSTARSRRDIPVEWTGYPILGKPLEPASLMDALRRQGFEPDSSG